MNEADAPISFLDTARFEKIIDESVTVETPVFTSPLLRTEVEATNAALDIVAPYQDKPHISMGRREFPEYKAVLIQEKVQTESQDTAIFLLQGSTITATQKAHEIYDIHAEAKKVQATFGDRLSMTVGLGSSVSLDIMNQPTSSNVYERSAYQALFIKRILDANKNVKNIYLSGQSLGGGELPYVTAMLQELMKDRIDTGDFTIKGIAMIQASGQYKQGILETAKGMQKIGSKPEEWKYYYPSPFDRLDMDRVVKEFESDFHTNEERVLFEQECIYFQERCKGQYEGFPELKQMDDVILTLLKQGKTREQLKTIMNERKKATMDYVAEHFGSYDSRGNNTLTFPVLARFRNARKSLLSETDRHVQQLLHMPIIRLTGDTDQYFPTDRAKARQELKQMERQRQAIKEQRDMLHLNPEEPLPPQSWESIEKKRQQYPESQCFVDVTMPIAHQTFDIAPGPFSRLVVRAFADLDRYTQQATQTRVKLRYNAVV